MAWAGDTRVSLYVFFSLGLGWGLCLYFMIWYGMVWVKMGGLGGLNGNGMGLWRAWVRVTTAWVACIKRGPPWA